MGARKNPGMAESVEHKLVQDNRGWYCLNCAWPGSDFTYRREDAITHRDSSRTKVSS